jgi:hypothetical protein
VPITCVRQWQSRHTPCGWRIPSTLFLDSAAQSLLALHCKGQFP